MRRMRSRDWRRDWRERTRRRERSERKRSERSERRERKGRRRRRRRTGRHLQRLVEFGVAARGRVLLRPRLSRGESEPRTV